MINRKIKRKVKLCTLAFFSALLYQHTKVTCETYLLNIRSTSKGLPIRISQSNINEILVQPIKSRVAGLFPPSGKPFLLSCHEAGPNMAVVSRDVIFFVVSLVLGMSWLTINTSGKLDFDTKNHSVLEKSRLLSLAITQKYIEKKYATF